MRLLAAAFVGFMLLVAVAASEVVARPNR